MKIVCDFCKTEYTLAKNPNAPVRCAVCGHVWTPHKSFSLNRVWLKLFVVICALISACIFSFVAIVSFSTNSGNKKTLFATINEKSIHVVHDENGDNRIFVSGDITNNTNEVYGLPRLVIISYDSNDNILSRQSFIPPATLLEPKTTVTFNHILSVEPSNVKRVSVELKDFK